MNTKEITAHVTETTLWVELGHGCAIGKMDAYVSVITEWRGRAVLLRYHANRYTASYENGSRLTEWRYYIQSGQSGYVNDANATRSSESITDTARARLSLVADPLVAAELERVNCGLPFASAVMYAAIRTLEKSYNWERDLASIIDKYEGVIGENGVGLLTAYAESITANANARANADNYAASLSERAVR